MLRCGGQEKESMGELRHQPDVPNDSTISTIQIQGEAAGLPNPNMENWIILYTPVSQEGTRVRVRTVANEVITPKVFCPEAKQDALFIETHNTVPVGTIVRLAMFVASDPAEQQSIEASVSFVCPVADQFGYSPGVGIRVLESTGSN